MNWLKLHKTKLAVTLALLVTAAGVYMAQPSELSVGGDAVTTIAGTTYTLAGAGITSTDTSVTLTSLTIPQNGLKITDAMLSETFYITLEPGSRSRQEIVSCDTVTQNGDNTATLSGCVRGLSPVTPYTASTTLRFAHSGGSSVIFSNPPQLYNQAAFKDNDETITGTWLGPTPLSDAQFATKGYVDNNVNGGAVSNDRFIVAGNAGETVSTSTLVYFDATDQEWKKVDVDTEATFQDKFIGLTQGVGTDGAAITGGILLKGRDNLVTGLTPGATYYASATAGVIDTTASAQPIGVAQDTNVLYFDPVLIDVVFKGKDNTFTATNTFNGTTTFTGNVSGINRITEYSASATYTKPNGLEAIYIEMWGGGGSGEAKNSSGAAGGGGGAYARKYILASSLSATTSIVIGAGGASVSAGNNGNDGGETSFGSLLSAFGGAGGSGGTGGGGGGELESASGGTGGSISGASTAAGGTIPDDAVSFGGGAGASGGGSDGGAAVFGGGGGGSTQNNTGTNAGGLSVYGGAGGQGNGGGAGGNGIVPGGGGGSGRNAASGAGGDGMVRIIEFF